MIVGILEADVLADEVVQRYGRYADSFATILSVADPQLDFQTYQVTQQHYPRNINECDAYLITGSKSSCYDQDPWIQRLKQFIRNCVEHEKKLIGICFGHQLIAHTLGGLVEKNDNGWGIGVAVSNVKHTPHWLSPEQQQFGLLVSHQDQVVQLPPQATLFAGNDFCPIASFQINQSILTFQGHPEFDRDYLQYLMTNRREVIGEQAYQQAKQSLQQNVHHEQVAQWIVNFIRD